MPHVTLCWMLLLVTPNDTCISKKSVLLSTVSVLKYCQLRNLELALSYNCALELCCFHLPALPTHRFEGDQLPVSVTVV